MTLVQDVPHEVMLPALSVIRTLMYAVVVDVVVVVVVVVVVAAVEHSPIMPMRKTWPASGPKPPWKFSSSVSDSAP